MSLWSSHKGLLCRRTYICNTGKWKLQDGVFKNENCLLRACPTCLWLCVLFRLLAVWSSKESLAGDIAGQYSYGLMSSASCSYFVQGYKKWWQHKAIYSWSSMNLYWCYNATNLASDKIWLNVSGWHTTSSPSGTTHGFETVEFLQAAWCQLPGASCRQVAYLIQAMYIVGVPCKSDMSKNNSSHCGSSKIKMSRRHPLSSQTLHAYA